MLPPLTPEQLVKPKHFELRLAVLYICLFIPNGVHLPYFPLWLEATGFGPNQIAVILAAPMFVRIFAGPAVSAMADRAPDRVPVLVASAILAALLCIGYLALPHTYLVVLLVSVLLAAAWAPHTPLSDSIALSGVRRYRIDYASVRVWGSMSFLLVNVAAGLILARTGAGAVPWLMLAGLSTIAVAAWMLPRMGKPRVAAPNPSEALAGSAFALRQPYFLLIIAASALAQGSHAFGYAFSSIYWKGLDIGEGWVGLLWACAVAAEVVMFMVYRRSLAQLRAGTLMALAGAVAVCRWVLFPLVWPAGLGLGGFFFVQALHAFSFSLAFLATQKMFTETVPEERMGAAQGAAFFLNMAAMALLTLASGPLYEAFGPFGFFAMAVVSAISAVLALMALRYPQSAGSGG